MCRRFWCRLHQQFLAGTVQTGPASFANHQRRALHGRRHQDGRGQKLPTAAAVVFHLVILHVLDFSTDSHLSSYQSSQAIGAKSIDLEWVQVHPTGLVKPDDADAKIKFLAAEATRNRLISCSWRTQKTTLEGIDFSNEPSKKMHASSFLLVLPFFLGLGIKHPISKFFFVVLVEKFPVGCRLSVESAVSFSTLRAYDFAMSSGVGDPRRLVPCWGWPP